MRRAPDTSDETRVLYTKAESSANVFNLICLAVLCAFVVLSELLNEVGLFHVDKFVLRLSGAIAFALFLLPIAVFLLRGKGVTAKPFFKYLIIVCAYLGIGVISVTLSFHAVLLLVLPQLIASQYRGRRNLFIYTLAATILLVPVSVYGSFFFGLPDRNLIKGMLTDAEALVFANRVRIATSERMLELFTHYTLPRLFCVIAIAVLSAGIIRRNARLLAGQEKLSRRVNDEMARRNDIQSRVIDALATLIETRDTDTGEHVARTKQYVRMISEELRKDEKYRDLLTDDKLELIEAAAPLHDVGKITVSDVILLKPAKLTADEFEQMKVHTVKGGDVIKSTFAGMEDADFLHTAEEIAVSHHEKWDGSGYPNGLKGEQIPLSARIMAIADVFDALVSVRVYKPALSPDDAFDIMLAESGTHFDPDMMRVVSGMRRELIAAAAAPLKDANAR